MPLAVGATSRTFFPDRIGSKALVCGGVGSLIPSFSNPTMILGWSLSKEVADILEEILDLQEIKPYVELNAVNLNIDNQMSYEIWYDR